MSWPPDSHIAVAQAEYPISQSPYGKRSCLRSYYSKLSMVNTLIMAWSTPHVRLPIGHTSKKRGKIWTAVYPTLDSSADDCYKHGLLGSCSVLQHREAMYHLKPSYIKCSSNILSVTKANTYHTMPQQPSDEPYRMSNMNIPMCCFETAVSGRMA